MIRIPKYILLSAVLLLLIASCSRDDYAETGSLPGSLQKISFEMSYAGAAATRVSTSADGTYTSSWDNGDQVGLYIVKGSGGLLPSGNYADNVRMTYNDGSWNYDPVFFPTDGDLLSFYAYHPYDSAMTDPTDFTFSVQSDQSSAAGLSKSNLLMASTLNVGKTGNPIQLVFSHLMAMVEVSAIAGSGVQMSSQVVASLGGCTTGVSANLATGTVTATGGTSAVTMYRVEQPGDGDYETSYTYRAMIPAQTVAANTQLFQFEQTQGTVTRTLSHRPSLQVALTAGEVKPYKITLQPTVDPAHSYSVGDYYPYNGLQIIGIVFEVTNGGLNGKIISLDQIMDRRWGDRSRDEQALGVTGIQDKDNGSAGTRNLILKHRDEPNFAQVYGLFNWIYQYKNHGDIDGHWYLPAINELKSFRDVWNADRDGFNAKLTALGYPVVNSNHWYVSSTEYNTTGMYIIILPTGITYPSQIEKDYAHGTVGSRAVSVF